MTSGVFHLWNSFSTQQATSVACAPINQLKGIKNTCEPPSQKIGKKCVLQTSVLRRAEPTRIETSQFESDFNFI